MFATAANMKTDFASQKSSDRVSQAVARSNYELVEEADTWDTHLSSLRREIGSAIAARKTAQREYKKVQTEANTWERVGVVVQNECEDLVRKSLSRKTACRDRERSLKALIDKYSTQIDTLERQMAYWGNQITAY